MNGSEKISIMMITRYYEKTAINSVNVNRDIEQIGQRLFRQPGLFRSDADLARMDNGDRIANGGDGVQLMADHDDRKMMIQMKVMNQRTQGFGCGQIQPFSGFIEYQYFRITGQSTGDQGPLFLSAGKCGKRCLRQILQTKVQQRFFDLAVIEAGGASKVADLSVAAHHDDFGYRERIDLIQLTFLRNVAETGLAIVGKGHAPFLYGYNTEQRLQQRGFAGAIGADDAENIAGRNGKAEIRQNRLLTVVVADVDVLE